jgi:caspase domain-containing protein/uncharacterized protein DUF4189
MRTSRRLWAALACGIATMLTFAATPASADKRLALVIGNSAYKNAPALRNPANDANDMAEALQRLGFDVIRGIDLDYLGMRTSVRRFSEKLAEAKVALLFYAGHGLQVAGKNYLVPVDAQIETQADLDFGTIDLDLVLRGMEADTRTNIIFLDACRDNPLATNLSRKLGTRSGLVSRGLAQVDTSVGTLISFSTQPGNVALDGDGRNSPFTAALLKTIEIPGLPLSDVMIDVRNDVLRTTARKQVPWDNSSLTGQFYFKPLPQGDAAARPGQEGVEVAFWNSIKDARNPQLFEAYLRRYPNGAFSDIARINAEQFKVAVAKPLAPAPEQKVRLSDPGMLREVRDRLYELNFDPAAPDAAGLKVAVTEFESQSKLPQTGEVTQGLLTRLREIGGLKPWGAIVYDKEAAKWGMAWDDPSRKSAVTSAREKCGAKCAIELSFFGTSCGAFALSPAGFSIVSRDDIQKARQAALDECGRRGKGCRIIGASCADGTGRSSN